MLRWEVARAIAMAALGGVAIDVDLPWHGHPAGSVAATMWIR